MIIRVADSNSEGIVQDRSSPFAYSFPMPRIMTDGEVDPLFPINKMSAAQAPRHPPLLLSKHCTTFRRNHFHVVF